MNETECELYALFASDETKNLQRDGNEGNESHQR